MKKHQKQVTKLINKLYKEFKWAHARKPKITVEGKNIYIGGIFDTYFIHYTVGKTLKFDVIEMVEVKGEVEPISLLRGESNNTKSFKTITNYLFHAIYVKEVNIIEPPSYTEDVLVGREGVTA